MARVLLENVTKKFDEVVAVKNVHLEVNDMTTLIQVFAAIFCVFMLYNAFINFRKRKIGRYDFILWLFIWGAAMFASLFPEVLYLGSFFEVFGILRALDLFVIVGFLVTFSILFYIHTHLRKLEERQKKIVTETIPESITETEPSAGDTTSSAESTTDSQETDTSETTPSEYITEIEIYLDGDQENGIFLGKADYNLPSTEAGLIYGNDFADSGFKLKYENRITAAG